MLQVEPYDAMQLFLMFFALSSKPNCLDICKHPWTGRLFLVNWIKDEKKHGNLTKGRPFLPSDPDLYIFTSRHATITCWCMEVAKTL